MPGKALPGPDIIFLPRRFSCSLFSIRQFSLRRKNPDILPAAVHCGPFLLHSPLQKQESKAFPGRTFLTKHLSENQNRQFFPILSTFSAMFHVKHFVRLYGCPVSGSCKICFRYFSNKNPLTGSLHPAGDFLFILNLRFFLHSFPEFPYR